MKWEESEPMEGVVDNGNGFARTDFDHGSVGSLEKGVRRLDEYDVDFGDTRDFTLVRWADIVKGATENLTPSGN
jgi:hypothetical protein